MKHQHLETTETISKRMANIPLRGGKSESALAKALWRRGVRYRKNYKKLPGSPDIAITKQRIAVFVDGEFWHGEDWEHRKEKLKRNKEYWIEKIEENIERDRRNDKSLIERGWIPVHFWEKEVKRDVEKCADIVIDLIQSRFAAEVDLMDMD